MRRAIGHKVAGSQDDHNPSPTALVRRGRPVIGNPVKFKEERSRTIEDTGATPTNRSSGQVWWRQYSTPQPAISRNNRISGPEENEEDDSEPESDKPSSPRNSSKSHIHVSGEPELFQFDEDDEVVPPAKRSSGIWWHDRPSVVGAEVDVVEVEEEMPASDVAQAVRRYRQRLLAYECLEGRRPLFVDMPTGLGYGGMPNLENSILYGGQAV